MAMKKSRMMKVYGQSGVSVLFSGVSYDCPNGHF